MKVIKEVRLAALEMSADDLELYMKAGRVGVAASISASVKIAINANPNNKPEAYKECMKVLDTFPEYGANDTEPRWMVNSVLNEVYGK